MKLSAFNLFIYTGKCDETLIVNTLTGEMVFIDREFRKKLDGYLLANEPTEDRDFLLDARALEELGILVDDSEDEFAKATDYFNGIRLSNDALSVSIMTTFVCDFECTYCYQAKNLSPKSINRRTEKWICSWISSLIDQQMPKKLAVDFFGGEPLLKPKLQERLLAKLIEIANEKGIEFEAGIISNGYNLERDFIQHLARLGLKWIKITVDGNKTSHDTLRKRKDGKSSYGRILENINKIHDLIEIRLSGNFDVKSLDSFKSHLEHLRSRGFEKKIKTLSLKPYFDSPSGLCSFSEIPSVEFLEVRSHAKKLGFTLHDNPSLGPCEALRKNFYNIDPDGNIFKCSAFVGDLAHSIGSVFTGVVPTKESPYVNSIPFHECGLCPYIPICFGSCQFQAYMKSKTLPSRHCEIDYFENVSKNIFLESALTC